MTNAKDGRTVAELILLDGRSLNRELPLSLLEAFHRTKDPCQDWGYLLRFLSPLTVPSRRLIEIT